MEDFIAEIAVELPPGKQEKIAQATKEVCKTLEGMSYWEIKEVLKITLDVAKSYCSLSAS